MSDDAVAIAKTLENDYFSKNYDQLQQHAALIDPKDNELFLAVNAQLHKDTDITSKYGRLSLDRTLSVQNNGVRETEVNVMQGHKARYTAEEINEFNKHCQSSFKVGDEHIVVDQVWVPGKSR